MKEIFGEEEDESRFKEAFNEIEIMKILRHRNIIGFIDSFIENKSFYIVMPVASNLYIYYNIDIIQYNIYSEFSIAITKV